MRLAFLSVSAECGGSESALWQLVRGVRRLAPETSCVVIVPRDGPLAARVREAGADVRVLPMPDALASFGEWSLRGASDVAKRSAAMLSAVTAAGSYQRALETLLAEIDPDVLHTNGFKAHVIGTRAAATGTALVWHLHEYLSHRPLSRRLLRHHVSRTAAVGANSHSVADDARTALRRPRAVTSAQRRRSDGVRDSDRRLDLDALSRLPRASELRVGPSRHSRDGRGTETFLRAMSTVGGAVRGYVIGGPLHDITLGSQHTIEELRVPRPRSASVIASASRAVPRPASAMRALDVAAHASPIRNRSGSCSPKASRAGSRSS
jgi:hypothetical protein